MRLWSIHPKYLDRQGLLACWREALLAQKVLVGKTKGYTKHPQLERFLKAKDSLLAIGVYLYEIHKEGLNRGYKFDPTKILKYKKRFPRMEVTRGQIKYEFGHLLHKLKERDRPRYKLHLSSKAVQPHPLFLIVDGYVEKWEKVQ